ncbi:MAG TPA: hypothetical protein VGL77_05750 [Armatimonadota bacterium]
MSVPPNERHQLRRARYEKYILGSARKEFVVGSLLQKILVDKLYQDGTHHTVETYCPKVLKMSKRRFYEYIEATKYYRNVRNSAQIAPQNIEQARALKPLELEDQQAAWRATVREHLATQEPLTVKLVEKHVRAVRVEKGLDTIREHMYADGVFIGIAQRLETPVQMIYDRATRKKVIKTITLPPLQAMTTTSTMPLESQPMVLVSPDCDLLKGEITLTDLQHLIAACGAASTYRFLLWSAQPKLFKEIINWPENIEITLRVWSPKELDRYAEYTAVIPAAKAIWVTPTQPISLSPGTPFTRFILGAPMGTPGYELIDLGACRQVLAAALCQMPTAVFHIATPFLKQLAQASIEGMPDGLATIGQP